MASRPPLEVSRTGKLNFRDPFDINSSEEGTDRQPVPEKGQEQEHNQWREIEPTKRGDDAPYRPKYRFRQSMQGSQNGARDRIIRVDNAKTDQPTRNDRRNDDPPIKIQNREQQQS